MVNFQIVSLKVPPVKHQKIWEAGGIFGYRYRKVWTDGEGVCLSTYTIVCRRTDLYSNAV